MQTDHTFSPVAGCDACEKNIHIRNGLTPVFGYQFHDIPPEQGMPFGVSFHVRTAQAILVKRINELLTSPLSGDGFKRLDPDQIEKWLPHALDLNEEHAMHHIPERAAWRPGIMLDFNRECIPEYLRESVFLDMFVPEVSILMDGNHRALRHFRQHKSMSIYVLTTDEVQRCFAGVELGALMPL